MLDKHVNQQLLNQHNTKTGKTLINNILSRFSFEEADMCYQHFSFSDNLHYEITFNRRNNMSTLILEWSSNHLGDVTSGK